jgi:uncharacterized protein
MFDPNSRLDTSQVEDSRGSRIPGGRVAVGGGIGLVGLLLALLLGVNPFGGDQTQSSFPGVDQVQGDNTQIEQECQTGQDANTKQDCRTVAIVNSVQDFWTDEFSRRTGRYQPATTRLFTQATQTGCGAATSEVGPFYCPTDRHVYIDQGFFQELQTRFGAKGGPFAQAYVLAHEYGHHVQDLLGTMERAGNDRQGPQSGSVRLELQADCYAGLWASHAATTPGPSGRPLVKQVTSQDVAESLDAAAAVGDDRIQQEFQGRVTPESWTHGSSAQRQHWFTVGYRTGEMERCETFSGPI